MSQFEGAPVSRAEYQKMQADSWSEEHFQRTVIRAAEQLGFIAYHTHDSRRSQAGYPDLHLVNARQGISLFRELKTMKGTARPDQVKWLEQLAAVGHDAAIWRPSDWFSGNIEAELKGAKRVEYSSPVASADEVRAQITALCQAHGMQLFPWQIEAAVNLVTSGGGRREWRLRNNEAQFRRLLALANT